MRPAPSQVNPHLHCFEHVAVARAIRFTTGMQTYNNIPYETTNCCVTCKLKKIKRDFLAGAVIFVKEKEQWTECTDITKRYQGIGLNFTLSHLLSPTYQNAADPLTGGGGVGELVELSLKQFMDQSREN